MNHRHDSRSWPSPEAPSAPDPAAAAAGSARPKQNHFLASIKVLTSVLLVAGCGNGYEPGYEPGDELSSSEDISSEDEWSSEDELGTASQGLAAACGGDDSNALSAALAVAIGNELGRWDVNTDFAIVSSKLELSATGKLHCGSGCGNITALLRLQDDASSVITNHSPATYRNKLTSWYNTQKTALTNKVNELLNVDEGVYRIKSKLSGKYIVPAGGATQSGTNLQQSDQFNGNNASEWRVKLKGVSRQLVNVKSGMCMDLLSATSARTNLVQRPCNGAATQNFRLGQLDAGVLTLRSDYNQAVAPLNGATTNGTAIVHDVVKGLTPEMFIFERSGSGPWRDLLEVATAAYSLKLAHSGQAMAVSSTSTNDGVSVVQLPYVSTDDRFHWYITQLGSADVNGVQMMTYQFQNRMTGKCLDLDGSGSRRLVQRTCANTYNQRFGLTPTGNLRNVFYTSGGVSLGIAGGSTSSGAQFVELGKTWEMFNMLTFEPLIAIEPHRLRFNRKEAGGPCGNYYWYDITEPNGLALDDPASTWIQLIFAGGKQTKSGTDVNPFIAQKVSGSQVAIDPTYGLNDSTTTTTGSCTVGCLKVSTASVAGQCCSCNGATKKFAKTAWSGTTYMCQ
jgi:hypothetical protein